MDHVQQHGDPQGVGGVDKGFQVLRGAEAGTGGKEIRHLIAEGGVIGMLLDGHDLQCAVSKRGHPGQDVFLKFPVSSHFSRLLGHADVTFIDENRLFRPEGLVRPGEGVLYMMDHGVPAMVIFVLDHIGGVCGDAIQFLPVVDHDGAVALAVLEGVDAGNENFKDAVVLFFQLILMPVPAVEVAGQVHCLRRRGPFPIDPAPHGPVKAEIVVAVGKIGEGSVFGGEPLPGGLEVGNAQGNVICVGGQIGIQRKNFRCHDKNRPFQVE